MCRVFKKRMTTVRKMVSPCWYEDQVSFMQELESPRRISNPSAPNRQPYPNKKELELQFNIPHDTFLQLPQLENPMVPQSVASLSFSPVVSYGYGCKNNGNALQSSSLTQEHRLQQSLQFHYAGNDQSMENVMDWRVLDKFVANQLSHDEHFSNVAEQIKLLPNNGSTKPQTGQEIGSTSVSSCRIDLWK